MKRYHEYLVKKYFPSDDDIKKIVDCESDDEYEIDFNEIKSKFNDIIKPLSNHNITSHDFMLNPNTLENNYTIGSLSQRYGEVDYDETKLSRIYTQDLVNKYESISIASKICTANIMDLNPTHRFIMDVILQNNFFDDSVNIQNNMLLFGVKSLNVINIKSLDIKELDALFCSICKFDYDLESISFSHIEQSNIYYKFPLYNDEGKFDVNGFNIIKQYDLGSQIYSKTKLYIYIKMLFQIFKNLKHVMFYVNFDKKANKFINKLNDEGFNVNIDDNLIVISKK